MVKPPVGVKRGPKQATAAQQNFMAGQRPPTVTPAPQPGKPNRFSASGAGGQSASAGMGQSASGIPTIPAPSSPGASASPSSLGMVPSASGQMKQGGSVRRYAGGGTTETNQAGSWGGANATAAIDQASTPQTGTASTTGTGYGYSSGGGGGPFSTTPGQSPLGSSNFTAPTAPATPAAPAVSGTVANTSGGGAAMGAGLADYPGSPQGYGASYKPFGTSPSGQPIGSSPYSNPNNPAVALGENPEQMGAGAISATNPNIGWEGLAWAAKGGSIEEPKFGVPYRNKWKAKNHPGDSSYKFDDGGEVDPSALLGDQQPGSAGTSPDLENTQQQGPAGTPGTSPDLGGTIPSDPTQDINPADPGQAGDFSNALRAVGAAYAYGRNLLTGVNQQSTSNLTNSMVTPYIAPTGAPTQPGGFAANTDLMRPSSNVEGTSELPNDTTPPDQTSAMLQPAQEPPASPMQARGGSVPSFDMGGGVPMPPPATPQPQQPAPPPMGGGVGGTAPPHIMRYLTGADAAPVQRVLQKHKMLQHLPPTARTIHNIASAGGPQQQYQTLQAYRKLSDAAGVHAKVALNGNGKLPPSLPHAIAFANKKFEYTPSPVQLQFHLKGQGKPTQQAARGGVIQSFDDGGDVQQGADAAPDTNDPTQQLAAAGAQQPDYGPLSYDQQQLQGAGTPVTVTATDLTNGHEISGDIPQSAMGDLVGNTVDNWITKPVNSVVDKIKDKISNIKEAWNPYQTDVTNPGKEKDQPYDLVDAIKNSLSAAGGDTSLAGTTIRPPTGTKNAVAFPGPSPEGRGAAQQDANAPTPQAPAQQPSSQRGFMSKLAQVGGSLATAGAISLPGFAGAAGSQAPQAPQVPQPGGAGSIQTTPGTTDANQYNAGIRPLSGGGVQSQELPQMTAQSAGGGNPNLGQTIATNPMTGERFYVPVGQDTAHAQAGTAGPRAPQGGDVIAPNTAWGGQVVPRSSRRDVNPVHYVPGPGAPQNAGQGAPPQYNAATQSTSPNAAPTSDMPVALPTTGRGLEALTEREKAAREQYLNTLQPVGGGSRDLRQVAPGGGGSPGGGSPNLRQGAPAAQRGQSRPPRVHGRGPGGRVGWWQKLPNGQAIPVGGPYPTA